ARECFGANLRELRGKHGQKEQFYIYQGMAFYRYFCGRYRLSLHFASKAMASATQSQFTYGRVLASDLCGHLLVQTGNICEGLRTLKQASTLASQMGQSGLAETLE